MKYPILQLDVCQQIVRDLVENEGSTNADIDGAVLWEGNGKKVNLDTFKERLSIVVEWENHVKEYGDNKQKKDLIEAKFSLWLYQKINDLQLTTIALADPGFWRYLSVRYFFWYIQWREPAFRKEDGKYQIYVDCEAPKEAVLPRCYIRGRNSFGLDTSNSVFEGTDLWRSHIHRVRTQFSPTLIKSMLKWQYDENKRLKTDPLRLAAKDITKANSNISSDFLTEEQADAHLSKLWDSYKT